MYDAAGNLVKKGNQYQINKDTVTFTATIGEGVEYWEYTYDLLNRLTEVAKNGTVVADYGYSPEGLREVKRSAGVTTHYVFEGTEPLFEKRISDGRIRSYVYALGKHLARVDGAIGDPDAKIYYYHTDQVGSVKAVTDQSGNEVYNADYMPFGSRFEKEGEFDESHGFTGKEYDSDTGLYYFNARWYDQEIGRFISEDQISDPNNPNLYAYVANNPLAKTDVTGNNIDYDNTYDLSNFIINALNNTYDKKSTEDDQLGLLKDLITFGKELVKEGVRAFNNESQEEQKKFTAIAQALLKVDGISMDDPTYDKKLQAKINELRLSIIENNSADLIMGLSGGIEVKGLQATEEIFTKLFGKKIGSRIEEFMGEYGDVGGHHVFAKAAFKDLITYDPDKGFAISESFIKEMGWKAHIPDISVKQRQFFNELAKSGLPNNLTEHARIATQLLEYAGATREQAQFIVKKALANLAELGVTAPTKIPWH